MKGSNDTSGAGRTESNSSPQPKSAEKSPPSRPVEGFALTGPSDPPDPLTHAYRTDLADMALAGRVIASHYAEPLVRHLIAAAKLLRRPADDAELLAELKAGEEIRMLDLSLGWAWGYGPDGRVGYIREAAIGV